MNMNMHNQPAGGEGRGFIKVKKETRTSGGSPGVRVQRARAAFCCSAPNGSVGPLFWSSKTNGDWQAVYILYALAT